MANVDPTRPGSSMADDPFVATPPHAHPPPLRYASFDHDKFSMQTSNSPTQARRALEAHMKETDRRIQDASRLGTSLLQQRKDLAARLKDLEAQKNSTEITPELQKKLAELEREYTEVGRETARAFLPKSSMAPATNDQLQSPAVFSGDSRASPSKVTAPSRKQRNQPASRVHDIEFATEISTSLLAQVRSLQAAIVDKDDALRQATSDKSQLEMDFAHLRQRMRQFDDNEQKYKDENWNLETQLQEITALHRDATDREQRLHQTLKSSQSDREGTLRDLEDLKATHGKLYDEHANIKRQHESDLHYLRRDISGHEHERDQLQKKVEELTSQNTELARAVALRWNEGNDQPERGVGSGDDDMTTDRDHMDYSPPPSPTKGGARQGVLETETLKSSLQHAHRMIQNLKNNIHREKTEKVELKRMLQDTRDELESRRTDGGSGTIKKRRSEQEARQKKSLSQLGAARMSKEEIFMDDPEWEDHDGEVPFRRSTSSAATARNDGVDMPGAYLVTPMEESTDAFETANENDTNTETEAFQTGNEDFDEDSGDATETEGAFNRRDTVTPRIAPLNNRRAGDRSSFFSTASTSADEDENSQLPIQGELPRYRMRASRLIRRGPRPSDIVEANSSANNSPAISHFSSDRGTPVPAGQSLGDELDGLSDEEIEMDGTPSRVGIESDRFTPASIRSRDLSGTTPATTRSFVDIKSDMVDSGMMTEPWEPEQKESKSVLAAATGAVGGLFAGIAGSAIGSHDEKKDEDVPQQASEKAIESNEHQIEPPTQQAIPVPVAAHEMSSILSQHTEPVIPTPVAGAVPQHSSIVSQHTEPIVAPSAPMPAVPQHSAIVSQHTEPTAAPLAPLPAAPQHSAILSQHTEPIIPAPSAVPVAPQHSSIIAQHVAPESPARPRAFEQSGIMALDTAPESPARPRALEHSGIVAQHVAPESPVLPRAPEQSAILSQHTEPQTPERGLPSQKSAIMTQNTEPVSPPRFADLEYTPVKSRPAVSLSSIVSQNVEPVESSQPVGVRETNASMFPPRRSSRRPDQAGQTVEAGQESVEQLVRPSTSEKVRDPAAVIRDVGDDLPMLNFGGHIDDGALTPRDLKNENKRPFTEISNNAQRSGPDAVVPIKPSLVRNQTSDEGTQTAVSSQQIDSMLKGKGKESAVTFAEAGAAGAVAGAALGASANGSPQKQMANTSSPRRSSEPGGLRADAIHTGKRPGSAGSMRRNNPPPLPPLPADHTERIVAAGGKTPGGSMGPPLMPASAYKSKQQSASVRSRTPSISKGSQSIRQSNSLRPVAGASQVGSPISRQTSVSSFASEVDQRFNPAGAFMYPSDVSPSTDPRMIQAITQTMIGEYLWKYTRKTGSEKVSDNRHRRFFWVHPYTRTLYWSEQDPSTAGSKQLKGKSVAIEAVRVVTDDNVSPPGLHRKSLVVVTPGREIVFTAPTAQRHETWFNALSYLLMRTASEREADMHDMTEDEIAEFNPGHGRSSGTHSRSASRTRVSLSSYNSRATTTRTASPRRPHQAEIPTLTNRYVAADTTPTLQPPAPNTPGRSPSKHDTGSTTMSGRLSSLSGLFRPASLRKRGSVDRGTVSESTYRTANRNGGGGGLGINNAPQDPAAIYDASIADSSEDLRQVIERQERDSGRLENVRACCDGKHDVGSLSHTTRHNGVGGGTGSVSGSLMGRHSHAHGHSHAHPPVAEPMSTSSRPRRGE